MKKILLRAPLLTNSGYGVHSRQIFEWLNEKDNIDLTVECLNWGNTPWLLKGSSRNNLIEKIMKKSKKLEPPYDITIQVQLPDEWNPSLGKKNIGISAFVETNICNYKWVECCNKMNTVIVPSKFTENIIKKSGILTTEIYTIHEWFNENISKDIVLNSDERYNFKSNFNFFFIAQLTDINPDNDRKNIYNTIKWTLEEFKNSKDVGLVIKINTGRDTYKDRHQSVNAIKNIIKTLNIDEKERISIELIHGNMSEKEIAQIYKNKKIKCYISATRGEGYGLPLVDAAAAGIPVVATNWSGHLDFLKDNFYKVNYKMKKISNTKIDNRIFLENFEWADPEEFSFKSNIRKVYENYNEAFDLAKNHQSFVLENFSKDKIKKDYNDIINL